MFMWLTAFICSDMASSALISQAGRNGVDIIFVPASDAITLHIVRKVRQ